jgi:hypothetical protein
VVATAGLGNETLGSFDHTFNPPFSVGAGESKNSGDVVISAEGIQKLDLALKIFDAGKVDITADVYVQ